MRCTGKHPGRWWRILREPRLPGCRFQPCRLRRRKNDKPVSMAPRFLRLHKCGILFLFAHRNSVEEMNATHGKAAERIETELHKRSAIALAGPYSKACI